MTLKRFFPTFLELNLSLSLTPSLPLPLPPPLPTSLSLSCAPSPGLPAGKSSAAVLHRSGFLHRHALHTQNKYYLLSRPHRMLGDHPGATTGPYSQFMGCYSCLSAMASHGRSLRLYSHLSPEIYMNILNQYRHRCAWV